MGVRRLHGPARARLSALPSCTFEALHGESVRSRRVQPKAAKRMLLAARGARLPGVRLIAGQSAEGAMSELASLVVVLLGDGGDELLRAHYASFLDGGFDRGPARRAPGGGIGRIEKRGVGSHGGLLCASAAGCGQLGDTGEGGREAQHCSAYRRRIGRRESFARRWWRSDGSSVTFLSLLERELA